MAFSFDPNKPVYSQIIDEICLRIFSGEYVSGQRLPSVREMAADASVNPNTMQKALSLMEADGLLHSVTTSGRFITDNEEKILQAKNKLALCAVDAMLDRMFKLGFDSGDLLKIIENRLEKKEQKNES